MQFSRKVIIDIQKLTKCYVGNLPVLNAIDLQVYDGEMFALLGPNGAGKTTLFSILSTLRKPTSGNVKVANYDILSEQTQVRKNIGIVFQEPALAYNLSAKDNLALIARFYGLHGTKAHQQISTLLESLNLQDVANVQTQKLSGGQRRRLELARTLVPNPKILFLDEATLGLDIHARHLFWSEVRKLTKRGKTVFFTTHYLEEADVADRIALINKGHIIALDTPFALKTRVGSNIIKLITEDDPKTHKWLTRHGYHSKITNKGITIINPNNSAKNILKLLCDSPAEILHIESNKLSLEDVFFHLTKHNNSKTNSDYTLFNKENVT